MNAFTPNSKLIINFLKFIALHLEFGCHDDIRGLF